MWLKSLSVNVKSMRKQYDYWGLNTNVIKCERGFIFNGKQRFVI